MENNNGEGFGDRRNHPHGTEVRLQRLEDQIERLPEIEKRLETWVQAYVSGAIKSFNNDQSVTHGKVLNEIDLVRSIVIGVRGDNGLTSLVKAIVEREQDRDKRATRIWQFLSAIVLLLIGAMINLYLR